jgi:hypothetical protein
MVYYTILPVTSAKKRSCVKAAPEKGLYLKKGTVGSCRKKIPLGYGIASFGKELRSKNCNSADSPSMARRDAYNRTCRSRAASGRHLFLIVNDNYSRQGSHKFLHFKMFEIRTPDMIRNFSQGNHHKNAYYLTNTSKIT